MRGRHAAPGLAPAASDAPDSAKPQAAVRATRVVLWLALPACASALLLGTTNTITQDFAPVPFLWVLPLALYLLTFVIAFDHPRWYRRTVFGWRAGRRRPAWRCWLIWTQTGDVPVAVLVAGLAVAMFVGCMVLHGELARLRPEPRRLTGVLPHDRRRRGARRAARRRRGAAAAPVVLGVQIALWACCLLAFVTPLVAERRMPAGLVGLPRRSSG